MSDGSVRGGLVRILILHRLRTVVAGAALATACVGCSGGSPPRPPTSAIYGVTAALLTAGDLGPGYSVDQSAFTTGTVVTGCPALAMLGRAFSGGDRAEAEAAFDDNPSGPYVDEAMLSGSVSEISAEYASLTGQLRGCGQLAVTLGEQTFRLDLEPAEFAPGIFALRVDGSFLNTWYDGYLVVAKIDAMLMVFLYYEAGTDATSGAQARFAIARERAQHMPSSSGATASSPAPSTVPTVSSPGTTSPPMVLFPSGTYPEQAGSGGAPTFATPQDAASATNKGPEITPWDYVAVRCRVYAPTIPSATPDGWWYLVATPPWSGGYYAVANDFWNGDIPGHRPYTHNTDLSVPVCP